MVSLAQLWGVGEPLQVPGLSQPGRAPEGLLSPLCFRAVPEAMLGHLRALAMDKPTAEQACPCRDSSHGKALPTRVSVSLCLADKAPLGAGTALRCCSLWINLSPSRSKRKSSLQC